MYSGMLSAQSVFDFSLWRDVLFPVLMTASKSDSLLLSSARQDVRVLDGTSV